MFGLFEGRTIVFEIWSQILGLCLSLHQLIEILSSSLQKHLLHPRMEWTGCSNSKYSAASSKRGCQCFLGSRGLCDKEDCRREGYVRTRGGGKMRIGGQRLYRSHLRDCAAGQTHGQPVIDGTTSKLNSATTRLSRKTTDHCSPV